MRPTTGRQVLPSFQDTRVRLDGKRYGDLLATDNFGTALILFDDNPANVPTWVALHHHTLALVERGIAYDWILPAEVAS